jgi:hypothetical protein
VSEGPADWIERPGPHARDRYGAARKGWRVEAREGRVLFLNRKEPRPAAPALPFAALAPCAALQVDDGWLVGFDQGEFGGGLDWYAPDGREHAPIVECNACALVELAPGQVLLVEGLSHLRLEQGTIQRVTRNERGRWKAQVLLSFEAEPQAWARSGDALLVLTNRALLRATVGGAEVAHTLSAELPYALRANSLAADAEGCLWAGLGDGLLRLTPEGAGYRESWLYPK